MIRPSLRQLSYLIAVENTGSFILAAQECNVTQSTLSAGIKELESILNQSLIIRSRKKAALTPFAQDIAKKSRQIIESVDEIVTIAHQIHAPLSGTVRLGVIPTIAPYLLPNLLKTVEKQYPTLNLQIFEDLSERLIEQTVHGNIDVLLLALPYDTRGLETFDIFEEDFVLASPKSRQIPAYLSITDIRPDDLLLLEDGHCMRDHALAACNLQQPRRKKTFGATSLATLIQMVNSGHGTTLLPQMAVVQQHIPSNISISWFRSPPPKRKIGLAWRKNHPRHEEFKLLGEMIHQ